MKKTLLFFRDEEKYLNKFREKGVNYSWYANSKYCVRLFLAISDNAVGKLEDIREHSG